MDFAPAFTIDTLGMPSVTNRADDPAAKRQRALLREVWNRNPPGNTTQDRFSQAQYGYKNHVYLAIKSFMDWMGNCKFSIQEKRPNVVKKAIGAASSDDSQWHPVDEENPCAKLFAAPNSQETLGDYLAVRLMCRKLFGGSYEYVVRNRMGEPVELHAILPQYLTARPVEMAYPFGSWNLSIPHPMYGFGSAGSAILDGRDVLVHRNPHPMFPWDPYSPLAAGGEMIDVLTSVIQSRKKSMDEGFSPDTIVTIDGAGQDALDEAQARVNGKYTGVARGQKVMFVGGESVSAAPLQITPDKMGFGETYKDSINFILALLGIPPALAGLTEITSFSALFAALKQFGAGALGTECRQTGEFWTQRIIRPTWPTLKAHLEVPSIEDDSQKLTQLGQLAGNQACTINEQRAAANMPPMDGGDVTPMEWQNTIQQRIAPPPQPGMPGADGMGGDPNDPSGGMEAVQDAGMEADAGVESEPGEGEDDYPHAVMQSVMGAYGVDSGGEQPEPDAEPTEADARFEKSLTRWLKAAAPWREIPTKTGRGRAATNGATTVYGKEAERVLAGPVAPRNNPDLDDAFGPEKPKGTPVPGSKPDKNGYHPTVEGGFIHRTHVDQTEFAKQSPAPVKVAKPSQAKADPTDAELDSLAERTIGGVPKDKTPIKDHADSVAKVIPPEHVPAAKKAVEAIRSGKIPVAKPLNAKQLQQMRNPQDWLPKMLTTYLPIFASAMSLGRGPASKLLIFGALAALHHLSKSTDGEKAETDLVPTAMPKKPPVAMPKKAPPTATPKKAGPNTPKAIPYPKNDAGEGSLPGRITKAADWDSYLAGIVAEEMGVLA